MRIAIRKESAALERRVAVVPESVKRLIAKGIDVSVEGGAGLGAFVADDDYVAAGARVEGSVGALLADADVVVQIRPPPVADVARLKEGSGLISFLDPLVEHELVAALAARRIVSIAVDMIPRTTAAQMMDALSSQATASGYEAVLLAAAALPRFFPMMMTAAGTVAPARVLVLGAGVAGLQAVGTAKRLGAIVEVFDVRRAVKEQVESLGAKFVDFDPSEDAETAGGYARELTESAREKQAQAIARHAATADVVICAALVPGRRAPLLLTSAMVRSMRPGGVVVDLAAARSGNCELTVPGETRVEHGVTIIGATDLASRVSVHASQMYSRNIEKLLLHVVKNGALSIDPHDEIIAGCLITHEGAVVNARARLPVEPVRPDSMAGAGVAS